MKRKLALIISSLLAVPILVTSIVLAQDNTNPGTAPTPTPAAQRPSTEAVKPVDSPAESKAMADRIKERTANLKVTLTAAQKTRIQSRCKASQSLLSATEGRIKGTETSRSAVHANIVKHLTELSQKLKAQDINTDTLDAQIITLQGMIETFRTDLEILKQTLRDLVAMDCAPEAAGFQASLTDARSAQQKVKEDSTAIRTYVTDTIKPLLAAIRADLEPKKTEGGQ